MPHPTPPQHGRLKAVVQLYFSLYIYIYIIYIAYVIILYIILFVNSMFIRAFVHSIVFRVPADVNEGFMTCVGIWWLKGPYFRTQRGEIAACVAIVVW